MALLEVQQLEVRYGGVNAVRGIDVTVESQQIVAILGANGAGKSSTINAISGVVRPARGSIRFQDTDITGWRPHQVARRRLIQVPEGRRIIAPLTVEENLELGAYTRKDKEVAATLAEVYQLFPILAERRAVAGGLLSGGEQQMLAFGRALMADPILVLLDEPSMGLAPVMVDAVMAAVTDIAARGISVLMVEQNAAAALDLADVIYVMEQGEVVRQGSADDIRKDTVVIEAFLGIDVDTI